MECRITHMKLCIHITPLYMVFKTPIGIVIVWLHIFQIEIIKYCHSELTLTLTNFVSELLYNKTVLLSFSQTCLNVPSVTPYLIKVSWNQSLEIPPCLIFLPWPQTYMTSISGHTLLYPLDFHYLYCYWPCIILPEIDLMLHFLPWHWS